MLFADYENLNILNMSFWCLIPFGFQLLLQLAVHFQHCNVDREREPVAVFLGVNISLTFVTGK